MLSRNAERVYWLGRYIERTEDTARLLNAFSHVIRDLPASSKLDWNVLLQILSVEEQFKKKHGDDASEENVISFLVTDSENPGSIRSAIRAARENARTVRDRLPLEGWEILNDLNLFVKKREKNLAQNPVKLRNRFQFLKDVVAKSQQFNGMVQSTLSRNQAYDFISFGRFIERADMTTRMLDVVADILLRRPEDVSSFDSHIWMEFMKAQNAVMMYRAENGPRISAKSVLHFLLGQEDFPRSIKSCLQEMTRLSQQLPRNEAFIAETQKLMLTLEDYQKHAEIVPAELRVMFDDTQKGLNQLHSVIADTWFLGAAAAPESETQTQTQTESS